MMAPPMMAPPSMNGPSDNCDPIFDVIEEPEEDNLSLAVGGRGAPTAIL